jgi:hypothetical protein
MGGFALDVDRAAKRVVRHVFGVCLKLRLDLLPAREEALYVAFPALFLVHSSSSSIVRGIRASSALACSPMRSSSSGLNSQESNHPQSHE